MTTSSTSPLDVVQCFYTAQPVDRPRRRKQETRRGQKGLSSSCPESCDEFTTRALASRINPIIHYMHSFSVHSFNCEVCQSAQKGFFFRAWKITSLVDSISFLTHPKESTEERDVAADIVKGMNNQERWFSSRLDSKWCNFEPSQS